ncbi:FecCD family ABC transporter permease [Candidatus Mycoplasma haematominutum]|uniref:Ferrichrome ABC transport system permease protein n=1 Tax=Candidatus Mycoplasma haematominutum 'Birmingham 1' TaxID=1116213 RepID=G8C2V0_9MOLU|nr:iron ABC transporter permease [Candidatus Mycoplasma haematominutum]CCE66648.1 ferrichrome ABC transport system permease protein [Candidatus Mycoplasma haematominutum 'Birmingham 1']
MSSSCALACNPPIPLYEARENSRPSSLFLQLLTRKRLILFSLFGLTLLLLVVNLLRQLPKWELEEFLGPLFGSRPTQNSGSESPNYEPYQKIVWISIASILAAVLLAISGNISQSLLQNPLADCSTLGMIDGAAFGLMLLKVFLGAEIGNFYFAHFLMAFFCAFLVFMLILFIFNSNVSWERKNICTLIILFGLVLNIFFRTATHLVKAYSVTSVNTSFALALGGAENIFELFPSQFQLLQYAMPITVLLFLFTRCLAKSLNLAELGFDQAHSLGVNIRMLQFLGYSTILCCNTLTINLVGNISFVGLISTHLARRILKTRKYEAIIPSSSLISALLLMIAITVNSYVPEISTSNLILALGAASLFLLTRE